MAEGSDCADVVLGGERGEVKAGNIADAEVVGL